MILYHFPTSPFAQRVRLILATKGLTPRVEFRDPRAEEKWWPELHRQNPLRTVPTLVDGDRVLTDSLSIATHLEAIAPSPSIWPRAGQIADALEIVRLADRAIDVLVDLGMRYHALATQPAWQDVKGPMLARGQGALDRLGALVEARAGAEHLVGDTWTLADTAVITTGMWLAGLPARAAKFAPAKNMVELGWTLPAPLTRWTDARRTHPAVVALDAAAPPR